MESREAKEMGGWKLGMEDLTKEGDEKVRREGRILWR